MRQSSPGKSSTRPTHSLPASSRSTARPVPAHCGASQVSSLRLCAGNGLAPSASCLLMTWKCYSGGSSSALPVATQITSGRKSLECSPCSMSKKLKRLTRSSSPVCQSQHGAQRRGVSLGESPARQPLPCCAEVPVSLKTALASMLRRAEK